MISVYAKVLIYKTILCLYVITSTTKKVQKSFKTAIISFFNLINQVRHLNYVSEMFLCNKNQIIDQTFTTTTYICNKGYFHFDSTKVAFSSRFSDLEMNSFTPHPLLAYYKNSGKKGVRIWKVWKKNIVLSSSLWGTTGFQLPIWVGI